MQYAPSPPRESPACLQKLRSIKRKHLSLPPPAGLGYSQELVDELGEYCKKRKLVQARGSIQILARGPFVADSWAEGGRGGANEANQRTYLEVNATVLTCQVDPYFPKNANEDYLLVYVGASVSSGTRFEEGMAAEANAMGSTTKTFSGGC